MRARIAGLALTLLPIAILTTSPALADRPTRGCPPSFDPITITALRAMQPQWDPTPLYKADANDDEVLCMQHKPERSGPPNLVDNVSNH